MGVGSDHTFDWAVLVGPLGFRCGYVRIPVGHPWHGKHYDKINADVHGGLTYSGDGGFKPGPDDDPQWWIGFDCGHAGDAADPELAAPVALRAFPPRPGEVVRDQSYVEGECVRLCLQAAKAALEKTFAVCE